MDDTVAQLVLYSGIFLIALGQAILGGWMAKEEVFENPEPVATA